VSSITSREYTEMAAVHVTLVLAAAAGAAPPAVALYPRDATSVGDMGK